MSDVAFHWARGANARDNHKREGKSSLRSGLPLSLKVFSRTLFPYLSPSLMRATVALRSLWQSSLFCFRRPCPPAYAPDARNYSLFILHHSLFTLSIGGSHATEAASSGVYYECWVSHAAALRREMEAGTARCPRGLPAAGRECERQPQERGEVVAALA